MYIVNNSLIQQIKIELNILCLETYQKRKKDHQMKLSNYRPITFVTFFSSV